jgi:hypothetical protein
VQPTEHSLVDVAEFDVVAVELKPNAQMALIWRIRRDQQSLTAHAEVNVERLIALPQRQPQKLAATRDTFNLTTDQTFFKISGASFVLANESRFVHPDATNPRPCDVSGETSANGFDFG